MLPKARDGKPGSGRDAPLQQLATRVAGLRAAHDVGAHRVNFHQVIRRVSRIARREVRCQICFQWRH